MATRSTSVRARMKFADVTALQRGHESTSDNQSFADLSLFKTEGREQPNYGTFELNQFVLDGEKNIMDNLDDVAFWSKDMSLGDCYFINPPTLRISFEENHTSTGVTLQFADNIPDIVDISYYSLSGTKLIGKRFYPDSFNFYCQCQVENFGRIEISFEKTKFPYQYARLDFILYGVNIEFADNEIQTGRVNEEIDVTSAKLSINTSELKIVDDRNNFNVQNPDGEWKSIQKQQKISIDGIIGEEVVPFGTFFMDSWSFSGNIVDFKLVDPIGLIDNYQFYGGQIYTNKRAGEIIDSIMAEAGYTDYTISEEVYETRLSGWLEIQSCREALQMVCFSCGAVADCSRSSTIQIHKPQKYVNRYIRMNRKFLGTSVELDSYVTDVNITYALYSKKATEDKVYTGSLSVGDNMIAFKSAVDPSTIRTTSGTIKQRSTNFVVVTSTDEIPSCEVYACKYEEEKYTCQSIIKDIDSNEVRNTKKYGTITLCNTDNIQNVCDYILDYYSRRKMVDMRYILEAERVGEWAEVYEKGFDSSTTLIEEQDIDLTGGVICHAKCRGYNKRTSTYYYADHELYLGEAL